ncbi:ectoine hydrolase DoeA [Serratia rubidaea]|uniref:ectoine hydrolase DoeA n=1 Tax=Serratia rubidaea TaxID=61652 RepID=UPI00077352BB|nr:ectoine hydrolase DoeA [Serratia rubidaea]AML58561.1 Xaa-Pro aminopeptidase [Serratia rubidaea]MBD8455041.1 ectoine hydrolase DoeA [Serratia rubidaea]MDC6110819.1 ectoine hydrolase DoeA [Serratia rubidaea]MDK1703144.1 ectoine hydrolase DoeA [Serratia rubidaea]UJD80371.1 ectoine hydrolase DoeA [Serratia rubidaea]
MLTKTLPFTREEYDQRIAKTRAAMAQQGIELLVVSDPSNMAWLTGYDGWSFYVHQCVLLGLEDDPVWFGRLQDSNGALRTCWMDDERIIGYPERLVQNPDEHPMRWLAREVLPMFGWRQARIGVEMDNYYFSAKAFLSLQLDCPQQAFIDATALVNWCRAVKSPRELEYMRIAARIVGRMHERIYQMVEPGLPKNMLVAEIQRCAIEGWVDDSGVRFGGDYAAIVPLLPGGADAAAPHLTWDDRPFRQGEGTFFEIAGCYRHYHAPLSRTIFLGDAPDHFLRGEEALLSGIELGLAAARPGNSCGDVARALESAMRRAGIDRGGARCGYPIGISYPPDWGERTMSLRASDDTPLQPGMTFHFMPGLWMDDWGLEITESIVITAQGAEVLCDYPRRLFVK